MIIDKKAINYYYSFFEVSKELNQKQFYLFNMAIYEVMFFEKHIDTITFDDTMLTILWKSVKHSLQASIKGYCDKKSIPYDEVFAPLTKGDDKPLTNNVKGKNNEEEKEKEEEKPSSQLVTTQSYDDSLRLANYLLNNILRVNNSFSKPNLDTWAKDIDKAIRIDGRTTQQLKECIDWIYSEPKGFWIPNIMSGKKLREKFDTMNMQVISKPKKQTDKIDDIYNSGLSATEIIKEMEKRA